MTKKMRWPLRLFFFAVLAAPLVFFAADPAASLGNGPVGSIYGSLVTLMGVVGARVLFCSAWLVIDALLVWRVLKDRDTSPENAPVDLHD